ncbi:sulfite exporter TauE/SafE family protein [Curvivirga sp.]|uniref:sulfite exporter TauE/SafE family protein n=1 Tax=Curvivirga sp. TaxID=2856848 RepID=UPI003B5AEEC8
MDTFFILPEFDFAFWASALIIIIAGMVRGFSGFGSALIMVPSLALFYSPITAVICVIIIDGLGSLQMIPFAMRHSDKKTVIPLAIAALIGIPLGATLLLSIDASLIKKVMAVFVLLFVILIYKGWQLKGNKTFGTKMIAGFISGLCSGSIGMAGPPVILYLMSSGSNPQSLRASITLYFVFTTIIAMTTFISAGVFEWSYLTISIFFIPFFVFGVILGGKLFHLATPKIFKNITLILLSVVGISTLIGS